MPHAMPAVITAIAITLSIYIHFPYIGSLLKLKVKVFGL